MWTQNLKQRGRLQEGAIAWAFINCFNREKDQYFWLCRSPRKTTGGTWLRMQAYSARALVRSSMEKATLSIHRASPYPLLPFKQFACIRASVKISTFLRCPALQLGSTITSPKVFCSLQTPEDQETRNKPPADGQQVRERIKEELETPQAVETVAETVKALKFAVDKPEICTAEELHYVHVPQTAWKLAFWRYPPRSEAPARNHPLLLLSGVGTNAIGFDLDPSVSLARSMAEQGFDTWILEVRGAGLSKREGQLPANQNFNTSNGSIIDGQPEAKQNLSTGNGSVSGTDVKKDTLDSEIGGTKITDQIDGSSWSDSKVATTLSNTVSQISEKLTKILNEGQSRLISAPLLDRISGLLEDLRLSEWYDEFQERLARILNERQDSAIAKQIVDLSKRLLALLEDGQRVVSPQISDLQDRLINAPQIADLQERLIVTIDDLKKLLDLIVTYDWDFDNYLEEDVPAAMDYIRSHSKPPDGKIHAIGHSMGGIILYALIASKKQNCGLASAVTLASSLDYAVSNSSLKLLLPLADPAQSLNVPAVPLGALMTAIHPLSVNPPYVMAWLSPQVSAQGMMDPELFKKLVLNNFCTIPAKLLLHLTSVFNPGGLRNRAGTIFYKDYLHMCQTPVLAVAGDEDLICPPPAVLDTVKALPKEVVTYKLFGGSNHHYGHYDLVCGRTAKQEVYPCIQDFLVQHDNVEGDDTKSS